MATMQPLLDRYPRVDFFDEFADELGVAARALCGARGDAPIDRHRANFTIGSTWSTRVLLQRGVTFTVYADSRGTERIFPFDLIPRIVPADEWALIERGIAQRVLALNAFLGDVLRRSASCAKAGFRARWCSPRRFFNREMIGVRRPARRLHPRLGHRSDPRRATAPTTCSRTTCARPRASRTCSRIATSSSASFPRSLRATISRARSTIIRAVCSTRCATPRRRASSDPTVVAAHARHLQFRVLRAHGARAPHGRRTRRGQRPDRARQRRLHEDDQRACSAST